MPSAVSVALDLRNNPARIFSLAWYLFFFQGYFLLHRLASMVGLDEFDEFLFNYVQHFKGQLVASEVSRFCRFIPFGFKLAPEELINFLNPGDCKREP